MIFKTKSALFISGLGFQHSVAGLFGAAGFGYHYAEGHIQIVTDLGQCLVHAVRVSIVKEIDPHLIRGGIT